MFKFMQGRKAIKKTWKFLQQMDCSICNAQCDMHCIVLFLQNQLRKLLLSGGKQFDYDDVVTSLQSHIDVMRQLGIEGLARPIQQDTAAPPPSETSSGAPAVEKATAPEAAKLEKAAEKKVAAPEAELNPFPGFDSEPRRISRISAPAAEGGKADE